MNTVVSHKGEMLGVAGMRSFVLPFHIATKLQHPDEEGWLVIQTTNFRLTDGVFEWLPIYTSRFLRFAPGPLLVETFELSVTSSAQQAKVNHVQEVREWLRRTEEGDVCWDVDPEESERAVWRA
jgi:hypothetical protein